MIEKIINLCENALKTSPYDINKVIFVIKLQINLTNKIQ